MKIDGFSFHMLASHVALTSRSRRVNLQAVARPRAGSVVYAESPQERSTQPSLRSLMQNIALPPAEMQPLTAAALSATPIGSAQLSADDEPFDPRLSLICAIGEMMTGQTIRTVSTLNLTGAAPVNIARVVPKKAAATPFELKDNQNKFLASVRSTGLYLTETGTAGSVQQVDPA